ncbi:dihydrodipicolinate synthase family protein [Halobellus salinisoli]|uniref:dihydrodipicolinate synthase family protein n=1 Tax=Halobellus salinisoli TaxID=3108500 RepID=UPI00300940C1
MPYRGRSTYDKLYNALITPFEAGSFEVDYEAYEAFLQYHLSNETFLEHGGLVVNPEAGEVFYMTDDEYEETTQFALDVIDDAVPTFVGVFGLRRDEVLERAESVEAWGADGIFLLPPMGSLEVITAGGSQAYPEVWVDHVRSVADVADLPIIVHPTAPLSAEYGAGLPREPTTAVLREVENVVGWKMTYNAEGYDEIAKAIRELDPEVNVMCASGSYYHEMLDSGAFDGSISGSLNYALEPMLEHYLAWKRGDVAEATEIWEGGLRDLHEYIYAENKTRLHPRYKVATWLRGFISHPYMRPPMPAPSAEEVERIDELLRNTGLETIDTAERERVMNNPVRTL